MLKDESSTVGYYPSRCAVLGCTHTPLTWTFIDEMPAQGHSTAKNMLLYGVFLWVLTFGICSFFNLLDLNITTYVS